MGPGLRSIFATSHLPRPRSGHSVDVLRGDGLLARYTAISEPLFINRSYDAMRDLYHSPGSRLARAKTRGITTIDLDDFGTPSIERPTL